MSGYREIQKSRRRDRLDRDTWASTSVVVVSYDVEGSGTVTTEDIMFGAVFEETPFFRYGVEVKPGSTALVEGDYPFVTAGVSNWIVNTDDEEDQFATKYYLGANVYINVVSYTPYKLRFRLSFEGLAMKNTEFFQGQT